MVSPLPPAAHHMSPHFGPHLHRPMQRWQVFVCQIANQPLNGHCCSPHGPPVAHHEDAGDHCRRPSALHPPHPQPPCLCPANPCQHSCTNAGGEGHGNVPLLLMVCASCQCPANACAKQLQPRSKRHVNSYYRAASHHSMRDVQKLPLVLNVSMRLFFCCLLLFLLSALCCGLGGGSLFSTLGMESREWEFQHEMMAWSIWVRNLWLLMNQILIHQYLAKRERSQITSMAKSPTFPAPDSKENGWEILHHQYKLSALWALFRVHPGPADFGARWFGRHFTCPPWTHPATQYTTVLENQGRGMAPPQAPLCHLGD